MEETHSSARSCAWYLRIVFVVVVELLVIKRASFNERALAGGATAELHLNAHQHARRLTAIKLYTTYPFQ
jgi:hypothetical protein